MKRLLIAMVFCGGLVSLASADGFIMPRPPHPMPPDFPHNPLLNVKYHHVDVEINDPSAVTTIDQVFTNPYHRELEADYLIDVFFAGGEHQNWHCAFSPYLAAHLETIDVRKHQVENDKIGA